MKQLCRNFNRCLFLKIKHKQTTSFWKQSDFCIEKLLREAFTDGNDHHNFDILLLVFI